MLHAYCEQRPTGVGRSDKNVLLDGLLYEEAGREPSDLQTPARQAFLTLEENEQWHLNRMTQRLGISRNTLCRKLRRHGIVRHFVYATVAGEKMNDPLGALIGGASDDLSTDCANNDPVLLCTSSTCWWFFDQVAASHVFKGLHDPVFRISTDSCRGFCDLYEQLASGCGKLQCSGPFTGI